MASFKALCLAGVASLVATAAANAADLLPPPPAPYYAPPPAVVVGTGWYLRGDGGVAVANNLRDVNASFADPAGNFAATGGLPGGFEYNGAAVNRSGMIGAGIGYQFNQYFRADVTGEYRFGGRYTATESYGTTGGCGVGRCYDGYDAELSSGVILANGYVDVGTWYGFTPFVGAGVGVSINQVGKLTDIGLTNLGAGGTSTPYQHTDFAYAFMAGVDYAISANLKFEVGYRYLNQGTFQSAAINCGVGCVALESQRFKLSSSEVRAGLRYQFADFLPAPAPSYPLVRKY